MSGPSQPASSGEEKALGNEAAEARLAELRRRIDELDERLVELLNERARVVVEVGRIKRESGVVPTYSPDREHTVLERIKKLNKGPLKNRTMISVYKELMSGSFALQKALKIVYLGPDGSFSHMAARQHFGASVEYVPVRDIASVFDWIEREHADYGLVPIENTTGGSITDTLRRFLSTTVTVCAELALPIHQHLMANCPIAEIERVYSRPQVFDQCRTWLAHNLPKVELVDMPSTTTAAQKAADEPHAAAIASELAAELYNLEVVYSAIEDSSQNQTRFLVIGRERPRPTGSDKTSLLFSVEDRHGALVEVLNVFHNRGINMTKIESHPSPLKKWEYIFFADLEGHCEDALLGETIRMAQQHCRQLEILGSYPRAVRRDDVPK